MPPNARRASQASSLAACLTLSCPAALAGDVTFFSYSDIHYGADDGGRRPPIVQSDKVPVINSLPGSVYPAAIGGTVDKPRAVIMQGDLINDGAVKDKYPTQWANYLADFGVSGEGRCKFPVFEGVGNHDLNSDMFVFNQVKERNLVRKKLGYIQNVSPNGYHYSWDWDGVHFVNVNLFPGDVWEGEADAYGRAHHPHQAREFLADDLKRHVGDSGRPVVVVQHFRPIDENWWTYSAADKFHRVIQDYNLVAILVGHQGGGVDNKWRGYHWISSNGELVVCRIKDNTFTAINRSADGWDKSMQKKIFPSWSGSGLPAVLNNGDWVTKVGDTSASLSARLVYQAESPTEVTLHWGTTDGGDQAEKWQNSKPLGVQQPGAVATAEVSGLSPWTTYYYSASARNAKGTAWAGSSVTFHTTGSLPSPWQQAFLGHAQRPGSGAHFADGTFTVRGSGRDIAEGREPIDNFQFVWQELTGNGELLARITSSDVKSREPKVGIMLRESTANGARNVALLFVPRVGVRLSARSTPDGGSRTLPPSPATMAAPCWLKLVRSGDTFTGHVSADGNSWSQVGEPVTVAMASKLCAGLAVTAGCRDESKVHTATFDKVSCTPARQP